MSVRRGPHDLLLHLRVRAPFLARRLDGILGMELTGGELRVRVPEGSWAHAELRRCSLELEEAAAFLGAGTRVLLEGSPTAERLPFPVLATKTWNHVAFWARRGPSSALLALPKPVYLGEWLAGDAFDPKEAAARARLDPRVLVLRRGAPLAMSGRDGAASFLPEAVDALCGLAREHGSYAQLVCEFPGDEDAEFLEGRLYGAKEWGTPDTPGPVLQKYVGRLHYASPGIRGLATARELLTVSDPD